MSLIWIYFYINKNNLNNFVLRFFQQVTTRIVVLLHRFYKILQNFLYIKELKKAQELMYCSLCPNMVNRIAMQIGRVICEMINLNGLL